MIEWSQILDEKIDDILDVVREAYESSLNEYGVNNTQQRVILEHSGRCWYGTFPVGEQTSVERDGFAICIAQFPDVVVQNKENVFDLTVERIIRETHLRLLAEPFNPAS